jgi:NAD-dependent dihydropyrimidine dehydrogenase PreA subunit
MSGIAIITEACIGTKDRACVDVCPVQCSSPSKLRETV